MTRFIDIMMLFTSVLACIVKFIDKDYTEASAWMYIAVKSLNSIIQ